MLGLEPTLLLYAKTISNGPRHKEELDLAGMFWLFQLASRQSALSLILTKFCINSQVWHTTRKSAHYFPPTSAHTFTPLGFSVHHNVAYLNTLHSHGKLANESSQF